MHEVRSRVVPDASDSGLERGATKLGKRHIGEPDIDGLALHVQAASRHPFAAMPEHLVGRGGTIAGDHLKRTGGPRQTLQAMEQIEQTRVDVVDIAGAKVTQEVIDGGERVLAGTSRR